MVQLYQIILNIPVSLLKINTLIYYFSMKEVKYYPMAEYSKGLKYIIKSNNRKYVYIILRKIVPMESH